MGEVALIGSSIFELKCSTGIASLTVTLGNMSISAEINGSWGKKKRGGSRDLSGLRFIKKTESLCSFLNRLPGMLAAKVATEGRS